MFDNLTMILAYHGVWTWLSLLVALIILESLMASGHLIGIIFAAAIVTILHFFGIDSPLIVDLTIFGILAIIFTFMSRRFIMPILNEKAAQNLNNLSKTLEGKIVKANKDFDFGQGSVRLRDTDWLARCDPEFDVVKDQSLIVENVDGATLIVKPVDKSKKD